MEKIDKLKTVPIIGKEYLVPCFKMHGSIVPVHNNLHDDKENGQHYRHYHVDSRFEGNTGVSMWDGRVFDKEGKRYKLVYLPLVYKTHEERLITNNEWIGKSKLKGLICKGDKCPHRGYDLSSIPFEGKGKNKVKTCPLHGTQINEKGKVV